MNPWEKYAAKPASTGAPWEKYGGTTAPAAPTTGLGALPPEPGAPQNANYKAPDTDSIVKKLLGTIETGASLASGAVAGPVGAAYGIGKTLTGGKYGTQEGARAGEQAGVELANKLTYQPKTQTGQALTQGVGRALEPLQALPVEGQFVHQIPRVPGAVRAAGQEAGEVAGAAGRGVGRAAAAALPSVDADTAALARDAHAMGFRLTPEQVVGGKYAKALGEAAASVPLSGSNLKHNREVFTNNVANLAGVEGGKMTRKAVSDAYQKWGGQIGDINAKYAVPIDRSALQALKSHAAGELPEVQSVLNYYTNLVKKNATDGTLSGTTFRKINTQLAEKIRKTSNGDLKGALSGLQEDLLDRQRAAVTDPADQAALDTARRHYAILKTVEPLAAKSPTGEITPGSLLGVITSTKSGKSRVARGAAGDLGKLADIGQRFLKEQPSSGTAERRWAQAIPATLGGLAGAGAGGAAAAGAPGAAAGLAGAYGLANLYNRVGPALTERMIAAPPL